MAITKQRLALAVDHKLPINLPLFTNGRLLIMVVN